MSHERRQFVHAYVITVAPLNEKRIAKRAVCVVFDKQHRPCELLAVIALAAAGERTDWGESFAFELRRHRFDVVRAKGKLGEAASFLAVGDKLSDERVSARSRRLYIGNADPLDVAQMLHVT